ncbi:2-nitropropane dioxygenase [Amanita muscaria]
MAGASGGALAAEVYLGGGFGFLAAGYDSPDNVVKEIDIARSHLSGSCTTDRLPIGVGFLGWQLEKSTSRANELLSIALDNHVQAIWLAFGQELGQHIQFIRDYENNLGRDTKVAIFIQTSFLDDAIVAAREWKVDVIVVQGVEAGGHGPGKALPLMTLLPEVLGALGSDSPVVLAAGGLATGAQIAAMLALGASGAVLGTRFLLTPESTYTDAQKEALALADSRSTTRTMAFDYARNTLGWPAGIDGRGLRNRTVEDFEKGESMDKIRPKFLEGVQKGDRERMLVWAGTGVGLMNNVQPAKIVVQELYKDCANHLRVVAAMLKSVADNTQLHLKLI